MHDDDMLTCDATATGILQCLRMLAEEAETLHLTRTLVALREAIETCVAERIDPSKDERGIRISDVVEGLRRVIH